MVQNSEVQNSSWCKIPIARNPDVIKKAPRPSTCCLIVDYLTCHVWPLLRSRKYLFRLAPRSRQSELRLRLQLLFEHFCDLRISFLSQLVFIRYLQNYLLWLEYFLTWIEACFSNFFVQIIPMQLSTISIAKPGVAEPELEHWLWLWPHN